MSQEELFEQEVVAMPDSLCCPLHFYFFPCERTESAYRYEFWGCPKCGNEKKRFAYRPPIVEVTRLE